MSTTIESLQVEVQSSATSAVSGIDALASSLGKLKSAVKGGLGLGTVSKQISTLNTSLDGVSNENTAKLNSLAGGLQTLSACGNLKLSSSIAAQITNIGDAVRSLSGTDFSTLGSLTTALAPLSGVGKSNLNSFISQLQRLPQAVQALASVDMGGLSGQITRLVSALTPLTQMGKNNMTSFITQLSKIPQVMSALRSVDMGTLAAQIQALANAFTPLATQMQHISAGFAAFPARIQRLIRSTNNLTSSNNRAAKSYVNIAAKIGIAVAMVRTISRVIASWITASNKYVEDLNLFNASMGEYAAKAQEYAEHVGEIMGIDPGEWMRNQGVFMTLASGFGVVSDRAYIMSQNLTQLGYDLSSFFNISFENAMQKIQSGLAGELEPLRRLGYDLSMVRLQQEAYTLGIQKKVSAMTQAEKAELRYYAIMTQVTTAQGDMARTLHAPANQLRILQAQVSMCARALGNIFIPALNAVLPYAIALAKVIRMIADAIASLFGFSLPEIDYSGFDTVVGGIGDGVDDMTDGLGGAVKKAKELKNALLGIDELNIISPPDDSAGGGSGSGVGGIGGGGLGFELPTYDFLGDAINSKVQDIIDKLKEWLGLNEKIESWADFMKTRLYDILTVVAAITGALAGWKILSLLKKLGVPLAFKQMLGITLAIGGAIEFILQYWNAWVNGVDLENFIGLLAGAAAVIGGLGLAFGTVGAAIGAVVTGLAMFVLGIKDAVTNGLNFLNGFLIPLGATLTGAGIGALIGALGGPIGAGIGALIGLAVGLIVDFCIWLYQNWDDVCAYFDGVMQKIKLFFQNGWNAIVTFVKDIPNKIIRAFDALDQWVRELPGKVKAKLDSIGKYLDAVPGKIKTRFSDLTKKIRDWFAKLWQPIKDYDWSNLGYDIGQWFGNAVKSAIDWVKNSALPWLKDLGGSIVNSLKTFFTSTLPTFFTQTLPQTAQVIWEFIKSLPTRMLNILKSVMEGFVNVGKAIIDGIVEGLQTVWQAIKDFVSGFIQGFKDALGIHSPSTVFKEIGGFLIDGLLAGINGFAKMADKIKEWSASVVEWFTKGKDGKGIVDHFKEIGGNIINGFKDKVGSAYTTVKTNITTWASKVKDWFSNSSFGGINKETFMNFANNTIEGFKNKIGSAYTTVKTNITTWAEKAKEWFTSSSFGGVNRENFATFANNTIEGFKNKIGSAYTTVKSNITTWATSVKDWFTNSSFGGVNATNFATFANNTIEGFKNKIGSAYTNVKSNIVTWASNVKDWFTNSSFGGVNATNFSTFANNVIEGFKNKIGSAYTNVKSNITTWATSVKTWFSDIASNSAFSGFATNVIDGFKNRIGGYYTTAKSNMDTFSSSVKSWFTDKVSNSTFYNIASDVINGFKNGIGELYSTCKNTITSWGSSIIDWFKGVLGIKSPSKIFYEMGGFSVAGFNNAIKREGATTRSIVSGWADSFTNIAPKMKLAVDTTALKYYDAASASFSKGVSANVTANSHFAVDGLYEEMADGMQEAMLQALNSSRLAEDMRRQADKDEHPIVQVGNRVITDAVTTQRKANGFQFVTT